MHSRRTRTKFRASLIIAALILLLLTTVGVLLAQNGFDIPWWTVDGGGGVAMGGNYTLAGTMGQSDAGAPLEGGDYALYGGHWHGAEGNAEPAFHLYLPIIEHP
jgi:hypothetical protein